VFSLILHSVMDDCFVPVAAGSLSCGENNAKHFCCFCLHTSWLLMFHSPSSKAIFPSLYKFLVTKVYLSHVFHLVFSQLIVLDICVLPFIVCSYQYIISILVLCIVFFYVHSFCLLIPCPHYS